MSTGCGGGATASDRSTCAPKKIRSRSRLKLKTIHANDKFFIIATQNPTAHVGVTVLGEALKDRFIWVKLEYQKPEEEIQIIKQEVDSINGIGDSIAQISQNIIQASRENNLIRRGSSVRGAIDLAALINQYDKDNSSKNWIEAAIMSLYNKIELEDGVTRSKTEIITDIVLSVLNKSDFQ